MGIQRENGYSSSVEGFLVIGEAIYRLAKSNATTLTFSQPCELPPNTEAEIVIVVDGDRDSKFVVLPDGATPSENRVRYQLTVPF